MRWATKVAIALILLVPEIVGSYTLVPRRRVPPGGGGGNFTFIASCTGSDDANDADVSCSSSMNVATGDLLVAFITWEDSAVTPSTLTDGGSNTFTFDTGDDNNYTGNVYGANMYRLSGVSNASATFTANLSAAGPYKRLFVFQYRPGSGETVTKDATAENGDTSGSVSSGVISTTGTDEVVCAAARYYATGNWSNEQIAGVAYDQAALQNPSRMWCRILNATITNQQGTASVDINNKWVSRIVAFKSQ